MDRTPCFNTLAANWQSAKIERADAGLEELHAELTNDMQRALAGLQTHVPGSVQLIPTQQTAKGYQMHSELDMVRKAEDGFARFHDAINARLVGAPEIKGSAIHTGNHGIIKRPPRINRVLLATDDH